MIARHARKRGTLLLVALCLAPPSCKRGEEARAPAPASATAPAPAETGPPKDKDNVTYVSGVKAFKEQPGDDAVEEEIPERERPEDKIELVEREAKITSAEEARELALEAATEAIGWDHETKVSPALTTTWPPSDLSIVYLVFPLTPIEHSLNVKVGRPLRIRVNLEDGSVNTKKLSPSRVVKVLESKRDSAVVRNNLDTAEQALVNVLLRKRTVGRSYRLLDGYREWFNENLEFMTDFTHRYPKAMKWFKDPISSKSMP